MELLVQPGDLVCCRCVHFRQHYIRFSQERYVRTNCGHCVHLRLKTRKALAEACVHFVPLPPEAEQ